MQKEIKRIIYMMNCQMNPVIYAFVGCYVIYQVQKYPIKKHKFMIDLIMNFLPKITLEEYEKEEKYLSPFINFSFDYVAVYCREETKKTIFKRSSEIESKLILPKMKYQRKDPRISIENLKVQFFSKNDNIFNLYS